MRSILYFLPPRFRRIFLLISLILLAFISSLPIILPFASATPPQANALSSGTPPAYQGSNKGSVTAVSTKTPPKATISPTPSSTKTSPQSTQPVVSSQPTPTPTNAPTPILTPSSTSAQPEPTPTPTSPPAPGWKPVFQQYDPNCSNPAGAAWGVPSYQATGLTCTSYGTLVRQATSTRFAELDLNAVNGTAAYGQNPFRLHLQLSFMSPVDSKTDAAIILRTAGSGCGGFIFTLAPSGYWQLQEIVTCTNIPAVASGSVSIDPGQLATITIVGQNQTLSISINGVMVLSPRGNGSTVLDGTVGLMVERPGGTSSVVRYVDMELDAWR